MKRIIIGITAEGSVNLLRGQLQYLKSKGYQTFLLAPYSERVKKFCEVEGCEHLEIDIERDISLWSDFKTLVQIIMIFRTIKPDIINLGTPKVSLLGMIAGYLLRVESRVYTCRGFRFEHESGMKRSVLVFMEKITSRCANSVIAISQSVKDLGVKYHIFSEEKSKVINKGSSNGIDLSLFNRDNFDLERLNKLKNDLQLTGNFVFGFVGRLVDRKGIRELFEAFKIIYSNNELVRLLIVGPVESNQLLDSTLLQELKDHKGVVLAGKVDQEEVPLYLSIHDVFVLPAWWEGFGNVLTEAAAMGIPVISTTGTGTVDAVNHGYNGILVPVKDVDALETAMIELLTDSAKRKKMGENGKQWALNFDRKIIWEGMYEIYQS